MKIHSLSIENTKRVRAVTLEPAKDGLTVIGGKNGQGKTSVLDAIAWALGGEKYHPTSAQREGSVLPPYIKVTLDNGIVVERKGKNSALTVTDTTGQRAGQRLLDEFISELALDLPKFMNSTDKQKADTLLKIIGVGDQLAAIEQEEKRAYNERQALGRIAEKAKAAAEGMPYHAGAPHDLINVNALTQELYDAMNTNRRNADERFRLDTLYRKRNDVAVRLQQITQEYDQLTEQCAALEKTVLALQDVPEDNIQQKLADADAINQKVRENLNREKAEEDAKEARAAYDAMTQKVEDARQRKRELLNGAQLPLEGLLVEEGSLVYNNRRWDCMSASEQMRVAAAIVRRLNPQCGFVLMDKLEQMDAETMREFGEWVEAEGLQVIATRVSTGDECQIIIEDGTGVLPRPADETGSTERRELQGAKGYYAGSPDTGIIPEPKTAVPLRDWRNEGGFGK